MDRNPLLDIVKGIGILLVVYGHSKIEFGHYMIYMFHMPLFFLVSGYLHKEREIKSLLLVKTRSLIKSYIVFFIICTMIDYLLQGNSMIHEIDIFNPNGCAGPLWFLLALFEVSILFQMTLIFAKRYVCVICVVLTIAGYILSRYHIDIPLFIDSSISMMLFYYIGFELKRSGLRKQQVSKHAPPFICLLLSITSFILLYILDYKVMRLEVNDIWLNQIMGNFALFFSSALVGVTMIFSISRLLMQRCPLLGDIAHKLGCTSLYIFALHRPVLDICSRIGSSHPSNLINLVYCLVAIAVSYAIGRLSIKFSLL